MCRCSEPPRGQGTAFGKLLTDLSLGFRRCQPLQFTMLVVHVLFIYIYLQARGCTHSLEARLSRAPKISRVVTTCNVPEL